jgi:hypothetical protein
MLCDYDCFSPDVETFIVFLKTIKDYNVWKLFKKKQPFLSSKLERVIYLKTLIITNRILFSRPV